MCPIHILQKVSSYGTVAFQLFKLYLLNNYKFNSVFIEVYNTILKLMLSFKWLKQNLKLLFFDSIFYINLLSGHKVKINLFNLASICYQKHKFIWKKSVILFHKWMKWLQNIKVKFSFLFFLKPIRQKVELIKSMHRILLFKFKYFAYSHTILKFW